MVLGRGRGWSRQHPGAGLCRGGLTGPCFWSPELEPVPATQNKTGKYVPPSLRDGASRRGESMQPNRRGEVASTLALGRRAGTSLHPVIIPRVGPAPYRCLSLPAQPTTMPPSASPTCPRTLVRPTCRSSSGPSAPSPASTWQRTRPPASPRWAGGQGAGRGPP